MSPAVADAKPLNRVQGLQSQWSDLALRDGRNLAIEIGRGVTPTPTLNRGIEESSSIGLNVYDPDLRLLDLPLLAEDWDAAVDGLDFRYLGHKKKGKNFAITLEDRDVALLRDLEGPKAVLARRGQPNETTRAEFIKSLVEEVKPKLDFYCPQLHDKQPIEKKTQAKKANAEAKENRGPGIGDAKHLTVDGAAASPAQKELGETAMRIANSRPCPGICKVAVIAALMTESSMGTAAPGNVLEALEPYTQVRSAEEEISGFLFGQPTWTGVTAVGYAKAHPQATYYEIAQAVQKSGAGESSNGASNYGKFGDEARAWVEAFAGEGGEGTLDEKTEPFEFTVEKDETYWDAIQRLAKEVNWRAFIVNGRFFYIDEIELSRGMVRLAIKREAGEPQPTNPGVEDVDYDYNKNKPVTEATVTARADSWEVPPGAVVTLEGYGAASVGFGGAPLDKGQKIALSSNRKAQTGEGRGRYIVSKISAPLAGQTGTRLVTITLKKPTAPLPEKAATTKAVAGSGTGAGVAGGSGSGSKNTLALAKAAFTVKGTTDWHGVTIAKWIYPALLWAEENGGNTEVTSGYRPGVDSHTASGASEHQGDCYASSGEKGAIDFGDFTDPIGKEHRESFLDSLEKGYPGPMLIKATGFSDYGHCSATGS